ncbi:YaaC family protein [Niallia sp. Krafla_26]|uniref:YaaC family protein n=1 Tax=Niallia sp. Krafla_26 TaxID=3064703 RepID=UPI003D171A7C
MNHPYKDFHSFSTFFSAVDTQEYLKNCYKHFDQADQKSYENCYPFIYYLEHAQIYYDQAKQSPLLIQPILLFYGFVHLIKACLLTQDPNYPENTSVLAHGVTTRKRKKQQYEFLKDEVKFQRNGLFSCMLEKMFNIKNLEGDKATMNSLLQQIPELNPLFNQLEQRNTFIDINYHQQVFTFPKEILDYFHMTENRFIDYIQANSSNNLLYRSSTSNSILFDESGQSHDFSLLKFNLLEGSYCFPVLKDSFFPFPEMVSHYLILFNLSMIARYETEWWSELLKTMPNKDYPFIVQFLSITSQKGPFLAYQYLVDKRSSNPYL